MDNLFKDLSVLVVGDIMIDHYIYGSTSRISSEAPVLIIDTEKEEKTLGGAGNVAMNIVKLGAKCSLIGRVGNDNNGKEFIEICKKEGIDFYPSMVKEIPTTTKTRIYSKHQQLLRIDKEEIFKNYQIQTSMDEQIQLIKNADVIIISDYGKGLCGFTLCEIIIGEAKIHNIKVFVDPKGEDWTRYNGAYLIAPNIDELSQVSKNFKTIKNELFLNLAGTEIYKKYEMDNLLITCSEKGALLINKGGYASFSSAAQEVFDVSGAGDTVISVIALCVANGMPLQKSIELSMKAAGIVIRKSGTVPIEYQLLFEEEIKNELL